MDFDTYESEVVARTGKMEEGIEAAKALGALGLCGEAAEVFQLEDWMSTTEAEWTKELGDVLWYVGYLCRAYGLALSEIARESLCVEIARPSPELVIATGNLSDVVKKELFHATPENKAVVRLLLARTLKCVRRLAERHGITMERVMLANQAKLLVRFPNGWDTAAAQAKADEAQR